MLRRLLILLAVAATVFVVWRVRRFLRARTLPRVPTDWITLSAQAPTLKRGLDLRDRLARAVARDDRTFQRALLLDVHSILAEVVELERRQLEIRGHLADLATSPAGPQRAETEAALAERLDRHARESAQIVADLDHVYLELLEAHEAGRGGGEAAARKTRALIDTLRHQAAAEKELARFLEKE